MARRRGGEAVVRRKLEAAPGLNRAEGHKLAGFLEGECHLAVVPNNADDWRCEFRVAVRDDDRDILIHAQRSLGLGQIYEKPAYRKSRPQAIWALSSKLECAALASFLEVHAFRGRKLLEFEIWNAAVALWSSRRHGLPLGGSERMTFLAKSLGSARQYDPGGQPTPSLTDTHAAYYLAGFFSAEGSFALSGRAARFVVKLRRDDRPLLNAFCRDFKLGSVCDVATPPPWSPAAVWHVTGARDVLIGIALLGHAGLLGRKMRQFEAWRPGAEAIGRAVIARAPVDAAVVDRARRELSRVTRYAAPAERLRLEAGHGEAWSEYLAVLRAWAATVEGPLSCTGYQVARNFHREWPTRNTITLTFGSWYEALRCAGLEDRAARRPSAV